LNRMSELHRFVAPELSQDCEHLTQVLNVMNCHSSATLLRTPGFPIVAVQSTKEH
jgi:hypothetical protein